MEEHIEIFSNIAEYVKKHNVNGFDVVRNACCLVTYHDDRYYSSRVNEFVSGELTSFDAFEVYLDANPTQDDRRSNPIERVYFVRLDGVESMFSEIKYMFPDVHVVFPTKNTRYAEMELGEKDIPFTCIPTRLLKNIV